MVLTDKLREFAKARGVDLVGCTSVHPFLVGEERRKLDPRNAMADAQTFVVAACYMYGFERAEPSLPGAPRGRFGPWTRGSMPAVGHGERTLRAFFEERGLKALPVGDFPLKMAAVRSGIACYGKNSIVHADGFGSYLKFSAVITNAKLDCVDRPIETSDCGDCTACVVACPTHALATPYRLNRDRCITAMFWGSPIPRELRCKTDGYIHRCGFCQDACPKNQGLKPRAAWPFPLEPKTDRPELIPLLLGDEGYYRAALPEFPLRAGIETLRRNVAVALGNSGDPAAILPLIQALATCLLQTRAAAAWALGRLGGAEARRALESALGPEQNQEVRAEIADALAQVRAREGRECHEQR
jgi:epoxyqueuosine reductase